MAMHTTITVTTATSTPTPELQAWPEHQGGSDPRVNNEPRPSERRHPTLIRALSFSSCDLSRVSRPLRHLGSAAKPL